MNQLLAGGNTLIESDQVTVTIQSAFGAEFQSETDTSIFLLKPDGKVRSDEDFVFYNQPSSKEGSVKLTGQDHFTIDLANMPADIDKLAVTMVIDGPDTFSNANAVSVTIGGIASFSPQTASMSEKALVLGQFYRNKGKWKFKAIGAGFNGGLAPLATAYGVTVDEDVEEPQSAPQEATVEDIESKLALKLQKDTPKLISLAKPIAINLKKHKIDKVKARVAFVLDASGSMTNQFKKGNVQSVLERIVPLSLQFDDDGEMEFWAFASKSDKYESVTSGNFDNYIDRVRKEKKGFFSSGNLFEGLGYSNNEPEVMRKVIDFFKDSSEPVYIVFITDGGIHKSKPIEDLIRESASLPIFWQFVGLGGSNYGILEDLDDLTGRVVDNSDFFNIDDFAKMSDDQLYSNLLNEFPGWLKEVKQKGIVN